MSIAEAHIAGTDGNIVIAQGRYLMHYFIAGVCKRQAVAVPRPHFLEVPSARAIRPGCTPLRSSCLSVHRNLQAGMFSISGVTRKGSQHDSGRVRPWAKYGHHKVWRLYEGCHIHTHLLSKERSSCLELQEQNKGGTCFSRHSIKKLALCPLLMVTSVVSLYFERDAEWPYKTAMSQ